MDSRKIALNVLSHLAIGSSTNVPYLVAIRTHAAGQIEVSDGSDSSTPAPAAAPAPYQSRDWIAYTFGGITAAAAIASAITQLGRK